MCIAVIVVNYSDQFPLIVTHNREEDLDRPTSELGVREGILSAIDLRAGGVAAVGLNTESGLCALLTDCRMGGENPGGATRGGLVKDVLADGMTEAVRIRIHEEKFRGGFHLYSLNCFVRDTVLMEYSSNVGIVNGSGEVTTSLRRDWEVGGGMAVIVRMNEHPSNVGDWTPKLQWVRDNIHDRLSENRSLGSLEDVLSVIESVVSETASIVNPPGTSCSWSPFPRAETTLLTHIVIPPIEVSPGHWFGTVSQTIIGVDQRAKAVTCKYRTTVRSHHHHHHTPAFSQWDTRVINYK